MNRSLVVNIIGCEVHQSRETSIRLHNTSNSILISGCRTFQSHADAVVVENSHEINITGNIFSWQVGHGIVLREVTWGTVSGNNINYSSRAGVSVNGKNSVESDNFSKTDRACIGTLTE